MEGKGQVDINTGKKIKKPIGQRKKKVKVEVTEKKEPKTLWEKIMAWLNEPIYQEILCLRKNI